MYQQCMPVAPDIQRSHFLKDTQTPKEEEELDKFVNQTLKNGLQKSIQKKIDSLKKKGLKTDKIQVLLYVILTEEEREFLQNRKDTQE